MFQVLILVCTIQLAPADCQTNTAERVIRGPEASNEVQRGFSGQAYMAMAAVEREQNQYVKITCTRTSIGKTVG